LEHNVFNIALPRPSPRDPAVGVVILITVSKKVKNFLLPVISELRIDFGPGYRVYFAKTGQCVLLLLCGGDKSRQSDDIATAKRLFAEYKLRLSKVTQ
jgi:hypothetical protein